MSEETERSLHIIQKELQKVVLILGYQAGLFKEVRTQLALRKLGVKDEIQKKLGKP